MTLSETDIHHLRAAEGWLELGNHKEADAELDGIAPNRRTHPDVLAIRWQIYAKAQKWSACVDIGAALTRVAPDRPTSWIHHAYALHELRRTKEAWDVLLSIADKFPGEPNIPYNLACYACRLGDLVGARDWLAQAFKVGDAKALKLMALEDPDLAPLWQGNPKDRQDD